MQTAWPYNNITNDHQLENGFFPTHAQLAFIHAQRINTPMCMRLFTLSLLIVTWTALQAREREKDNEINENRIHHWRLSIYSSSPPLPSVPASTPVPIFFMLSTLRSIQTNEPFAYACLCLHFMNRTNPHILFSYQLESSEWCDENEQIGINVLFSVTVSVSVSVSMCVCISLSI